MVFKSYYFINYLMHSQFNQKINFLIKYINNTYLYELELILKLHSMSQNRNRFILMLILMEKLLNNKLIFLLDQRTLSRTKPIKIGCVIHLRKEMLYLFINLYCMHNIPKFYNSEIVFDFSKSLFMKYEIQKILSNIIFNFEKDLTFYYDYLNEFNYNISFFFKSIFNSVWLNKILLNHFGFNFYNSIVLNIESFIINGWYFNLIEQEEDENEEEYEEEKEDEESGELLFLSNYQNKLNLLNNAENFNEDTILLVSFIFSEDILDNNFIFYLNFEF